MASLPLPNQDTTNKSDEDDLLEDLDEVDNQKLCMNAILSERKHASIDTIYDIKEHYSKTSEFLLRRWICKIY